MKMLHVTVEDTHALAGVKSQRINLLIETLTIFAAVGSDWSNFGSYILRTTTEYVGWK